MSKINYHNAFLDALPVIIVALPFGILFGLSAKELGFSLSTIIFFSTGTFAGASQLVAIQLMSENAPAIIVIISALAVNLRLVMYSAALSSHFRDEPLSKRFFAACVLVDQNTAIGMIKYDNASHPASKKILYFTILGLCIWSFWIVGVSLGATIGHQIQPTFDLAFVFPIMFIAIFSVTLLTPAHSAAACASAIFALLLHSIPYNLGLLIAAFIAMAIGAELERRTEKNQK